MSKNLTYAAVTHGSVYFFYFYFYYYYYLVISIYSLFNKHKAATSTLLSNQLMLEHTKAAIQKIRNLVREQQQQQQQQTNNNEEDVDANGEHRVWL